MRSRNYQLAIEKLKNFLEDPEMKKNMGHVIESRDKVLARYQPVFKIENLPYIFCNEFKSFLFFKNNRHWSGLHRNAPSMWEEMDYLGETLTILLDLFQPLARRYDAVARYRPWMQRSLMTSILMVSYPEQYGVWNNTSERALKSLSLWKENVQNGTVGQQYEQVNKLLNKLATNLRIDLWTLDALLWDIAPWIEGEQIPDHTEIDDNIIIDDVRAALARRPLKSDHVTLFKALYNAGWSGMEGRELAETMKISPQQLCGVMDSLENRINKSEALESKGAIRLVLEINELNNGKYLYTMRPILKIALEKEGII